MTKPWATQRESLTATLRQAVQRAIKTGEGTFQKLEGATGVKRQSLMKFARGQQSLRLDMADRLAEYFGYRVDRTMPNMDVRDVFDYASSRLIECNHLRRIFDEKYLQHILYEALWHQFGEFVDYECHYSGIPARNEVDLAIPWQLAIEVKWLTQNLPNRHRHNNREKLVQKISDLCRLAFIQVDQRDDGKESQCWLIYGGNRRAFSDFYSWDAKPKQRRRAIADQFFPLDPTNSVSELDLGDRCRSLAETRADVYEPLVNAIKGLKLPERVKLVSHGTGSLFNDDYDYCVVGWELAWISDETFSIAK